MSTKSSYSRVLIREWSGYEQVAIWDNCRWSVRLYMDRAIYKGHSVRWSNNSGSLCDVHERWTGKIVNAIKAIYHNEITDDADYTDQIYAIVYGVD